MIFSILCGIVFGLERKLKHKSVGIKTNVLICLGSCLFTQLALMFEAGDPLRVIGQIVTGVGFLGAGAIIRSGDRISGLTTAAVVWMVAALGVMSGIGLGLVAFVYSVFIVSIMLGLTWIEHKFFPDPDLASGLPASPKKETS